MKYIPLYLLLIVFLTISSCAKSDRQNPRELNEEEQNIDKVVWEASFQDLDDNEVKVSDFGGKVVLIDFWETWCGPCLQVFPAMDSLQNEYPDDFVVITVNLNDSDTPEDVAAFRNNNSYGFLYTIDHENIGSEIIKLGIPFKVFIDPKGYLIKTELGSAGTEGDYQKAKKIIEQYKTS